MKVNTASHFEPEKLKFPVLASVKMDGWRAYNKDRVLLTRSNKPVPNTHTQLLLNNGSFHGLDGELCAGNPWDKNLMQQSQSAFSAEHGEPKFTWEVFDIWTMKDYDYIHRYQALKAAFADPAWGPLAKSRGIRLVEQKLLLSMESLELFEREALAKGYEGIMLRDPKGRYKEGKSTVREGGLLKVKRYKDSEMLVESFEEQMYNANEAFIDETGRTKRSAHQANKIGKGTLGVIVGRDVVTNQTVRLGTGFDDALRAKIWGNTEAYRNLLATYKHFDHGVKEGIRHGVFKSFRDRRDMD